MPESVRPTRIAVHCQDRLTGDAIASWLDTLPGWLVVGTTVGAEATLRLCRLRPPDVAVVRIDPAELAFVDKLTGEHPGLHVIAECPDCRADDVARLRQAGVRQVICVRGGLASLRAALQRAAGARVDESAAGALTDRELEVLALVCRGLTAAELGSALHLSPHTVGNYKRRIFGKLGVQSRTQAAVDVARLGLVRAPVGRRLPGPPARSAGVLALTHREHDILASIARGDSVRQTAHALGIAVKTVQAVQRQLYFKLRVHNRAQALAEAGELGLIDT